MPGTLNNLCKQTKNFCYCSAKYGILCPAFGEHCSKWENENQCARACKSSSFQNTQDYIDELEHQHNSTSNTINY